MKSMRGITTKIAGVALATVMAFGGMSVFAAETGDQVYSENLYVTAARDSVWDNFHYFSSRTTMTVPEDGIYTITLSSDHDEDSYKSIKITDANGRIPLDSSGYWESVSYQGIDLYAGVEYSIEAYAKDYMGWTFAYDGVAMINVTLTLTEKIEEEVVPEIPEEPEEIIEVEEEPVAAATPAEQPAVTAMPVIPTLTAEQMRALAVRNFVGHLYIEGLGRRSTEAQITEWADKLLCCSITATEAASQILTSSEMNEHNFDNEQLAVILDEVFNTNAASDTAAQLNNGASVESVIEQLAGTDNWTTKCAFYEVNV